MKEQPIIFNAEMVRAILEGRKTQTRRPCKAQWLTVAGFEPWFGCEDGHQFWIARTCPADLKTKAPDRSDQHSNVVTKCPFGRAGDRLWVRETFTYITLAQNEMQPGDRWDPEFNCPVRLLYRADGIEIPANWTPSIHMRRWASRITLEITDVRVQRFAQMSDSDAMAEGVEYWRATPNREPRHRVYLPTFMELWDSIYANRGLSWDTNPWMWVITFRRLEQTHDCPQTPISANCGISGAAQ